MKLEDMSEFEDANPAVTIDICEMSARFPDSLKRVPLSHCGSLARVEPAAVSLRVHFARIPDTFSDGEQAFARVEELVGFMERVRLVTRRLILPSPMGKRSYSSRLSFTIGCAEWDKRTKNYFIPETYLDSLLRGCMQALFFCR